MARPLSRWRPGATALTLVLAAFSPALTTVPADAAAPAWTRTWGTAMTIAAPAEWPAPPGKQKSDRRGSQVRGQQTLRMVVHTSTAGSATRIHLVNTFSTTPVTIGHATVANRDEGGSATGSPVTLTFGGKQSTVLPPGGSIDSDPAAFSVKADEDLLVSLHLPDPVAMAPFHPYTLTSSYTTAPGDAADHSAEAGNENFGTAFPYWAFLSGVDVMSVNSGGTTVLLGDSQTDGGHTTDNANRRWGDDYARALQARERPMGVVNAGISGGFLLTDHPDYGQSAIGRFDRDVLEQPNVKSVILYQGINDIVYGNASAPDIVGGIRRLASRARSAGITFTAATIPPFRGYGRYDARMEQVRQDVNEYIRRTGEIDAYVDFDRASRDPLDPSRLFAAYYNRGDDRLHFGDNGSQALSDSVAPPPVPRHATARYDQTTVADFTGDGIPDAIARGKNEGNAPLYFWSGNSDVDDRSKGDGTFGQVRKQTDGWNFTQTAAADFTGDGKADIIAKGDDNVLYLWAGGGNGDFSRKRKLLGDFAYTEVVAADFTGDGHADLVARDAGGDLHLWTGDGKGGFSREVRLTGGWNFTQTTAGDFTGDGKSDLIAKDQANDLYLWTGGGNGDFSRKRKLLSDWNYSQTSAVPFRTGGIAHLMARSDATGVLHEWLDLGGASFSSPLRLADSW
ncbi:FG-GAP-like repeat-containing protein [Streptomyces sp. NPDC049555]|uniref:FG-GAP-like repeat-containing protein n=1 Tax=unclassified Streptomyces TaxID=2593676 RepID=UPI00341B69A2